MSGKSKITVQKRSANKISLSIKAKQALFFIVGMAIVLATIISILYFKSSDELKALAINTSHSIAQKEAAAFIQETDRAVRTLQSLGLALADGMEEEKSRDELSAIIRNYLVQYSEYSSFWAITESPSGFAPHWSRIGGGIAYRANPDYFENNEAGTVFQTALTSNEIFMSDPLTHGWDESGESVFLVSLPLVDSSNRKLGVVGLEIPGSRIDALVDDIRPLEDGYAFLLSGDADWISYPSKPQLFGQNLRPYANPDYVEELLGHVKAGQVFEEIKAAIGTNDLTLVVFQPITITGSSSFWSLGVMVPIQVLLNPVRNIAFIATLTAIIAIALFAFLAWLISAATLKPLDSAVKEMAIMAKGEGDLTQSFAIKQMDEVGKLMASFNDFVSTLRSMISALKENSLKLGNVGVQLASSAHETASAANEIQANLKSVEKQTDDQSVSVSEVSSAIAEITKNIESLDRVVEQQATSVTQASSSIEEMVGNIASVGKSVNIMATEFLNLVDSANTGRTKQDLVAALVKEISEQSAQLMEANSVIANIANKTNLLAMNAAIEAAHAGDAGRGFSVVADEIRKLAETSSEQSKNIKKDLGDIQKSIGKIVEGSNDSGQSFTEVAERIDRTAQLLDEIRSALEEQETGSKQILEALKIMNDISSEVKLSTREMTAGNKTILDEMLKLEGMSNSVKGSMTEMAAGSSQIAQAAVDVSTLAEDTKDSISEVDRLVGRFKT